MTVDDYDRCNNRLELIPSVFCAVHEKSTTCGGDSGGPAIIDEELAGVVSYGRANCDGSIGDAFTRVYDYVDWIVEIVNQNSDYTEDYAYDDYVLSNSTDTNNVSNNNDTTDYELPYYDI